MEGKNIGKSYAGNKVHHKFTTNKATGNIFRKKMINKIRKALVFNNSFLV
jgi:hypothetical protein